MNKYNLRKSFTAIYSNQEKVIRGKLALKTKELDWLETPYPVIILISVQSAFHEEINGDLKMNALISTIKNHVKGGVTILFSDRAHLHTMSLKYEENLMLAFQECWREANALHFRYQSYFEGSQIAYWHSYICQDPSFEISLNFLNNAYQQIPLFRTCWIRMLKIVMRIVINTDMEMIKPFFLKRRGRIL